MTSCPQTTTCLDYRIPEAGECAGSGKCAVCEPRPTRAGIPCGIGAQCDGTGECKVTALGRVAAGTNHTCAILENAQAASVDGVTDSSGNVLCWGDNAFGQLGAAFDRPFVGDDETPASLHSELEINFGRTVIQITAGFAHTCVLFEDDGKVRCWGPPGLTTWSPARWSTCWVQMTSSVNSFGFVDPLTTGDVRLSERAVQISAANGGDHTCAVLASGKVSCWGLNNHRAMRHRRGVRQRRRCHQRDFARRRLGSQQPKHTGTASERRR